MSIGRFYAPAVVLIVSAAACRHAPPAAVSTPRTPAPPVVQPAPPAPPPPRAAAPAQSRPLTEAQLFQRMSIDALNASHPLGDVFFDYDENTLRDDAKRTLQSDAQWLARWPSTSVRIDGSCDERGSAEYNLALGDRRAVVAKEYLGSLGVPAHRIQVRSLGKDAPFCRDSSESCWGQNRRDHIVITGK